MLSVPKKLWWIFNSIATMILTCIQRKLELFVIKSFPNIFSRFHGEFNKFLIHYQYVFRYQIVQAIFNILGSAFDEFAFFFCYSYHYWFTREFLAGETLVLRKLLLVIFSFSSLLTPWFWQHHRQTHIFVIWSSLCISEETTQHSLPYRRIENGTYFRKSNRLTVADNGIQNFCNGTVAKAFLM